MYIIDVVKRAQSYCPSEYDTEEMYLWCDEVSSMLAIEDRNVFVKETLQPSKDGSILLPEGVAFENVYSVTCNGKSLKKEDIRNSDNRSFLNSAVEVIYLKPYMPIRTVKYSGAITVDNTECKIVINSNLFRIGDGLNIKMDNVSSQAKIIDMNLNDDCWELCLTSKNLDALPENGLGEIERIVTDKTVCDSPYDGMYIDYIIAKICLYQRDFNTYNQFMALFNSRLSAYKRWITNQLPQAGGKLKNWW